MSNDKLVNNQLFPEDSSMESVEDTELKNLAYGSKGELGTGFSQLPAELDVHKSSIPRIRVTQIGSGIGRKYDQEQTLIGLGLNKMYKTVILENTASIRGMVKKIQHLLKVENLN